MLEQMVESYRSLGLREWFIDRIVATPPESMWYPPKPNLNRAGRSIGPYKRMLQQGIACFPWAWSAAFPFPTAAHMRKMR
jgi:hypothetical protein